MAAPTNLLDGLSAPTSNATDNGDGTYTVKVSGGSFTYVLDHVAEGQGLAASTTFHGGMSVMSGSDLDAGSFKVTLRYLDSAGNTKFFNVPSPAMAKGTWYRICEDFAVPAGASLSQYRLTDGKGQPTVTVTNASLSVGGAVPLAVGDCTTAQTAKAAKSTADSLATMIREDATGITVGKSADGQTWSTGRTHMTADSFDVLDKAGTAISSFGAKLVSLLKGTFQIKVWDGHSAGAMLQADDLSLSSKYQTMVSSVAPKASEGSMASAADTVYSSGATKSPDGVSELAITNEVFDASDKSLGTTKLTTDGFTTNVPLEAAVTRTTLATGVVLECTCGIAVLQVDGVKNSTTSGSWNDVQIGTVPSAYLPKQKVFAPAAKANNVDCGMTYIEVDTDGKVKLTDIGGSQTHGQLCYGTLMWIYV